MAQLTVPAPDARICSGWTEQDRGLYNKLPFYLVKMQLEYMSTWNTWAKLVGKVKWSPNMGETMRRVSKEPSPNIRQFATPSQMNQVPKKDVIDVRERTVDAVVYRHRFESPVLNFLPDFTDFLTDHVDRCSTDINEKITRFNDIFIRGYIFHYSPFVFLPNKADGEFVSAPTGYPTYSYDAVNKKTTLTTAGKTTAYLQGVLPLIGNPGNLSLNAINLAVTILETDQRIGPYSGSQAKDNPALQNKYCLVLSGEAYNQFIYDPWLLANKNIQLDVIKDGFTGNLFGRVVCKLEDLPIRISADGTFPDPETRELNPDAYNAGESVPNSVYTSAPYEVAFLLGYGQGYKAIEVGAPPKQFAGNGMPKGFGNMFWNGEVEITKNLILQCQDANGNTIYDTNKYGEYLQLISQATFGCVGEQTRSIIPIIYKRWRGAKNPVNV